VKGCREIAQLIREVAPGASRIVLPVGTGTTLAGIVSGLAPTAEVVGISALKGALDLDQRGFDW
jgi:1-aminocyclopropane-1-carboxylate deaminase